MGPPLDSGAGGAADVHLAHREMILGAAPGVQPGGAARGCSPGVLLPDSGKQADQVRRDEAHHQRDDDESHGPGTSDTLPTRANFPATFALRPRLDTARRPGLSRPDAGFTHSRRDGSPVIETWNLTRRYGSRTAVDGLTFRVPRGEVVGFLGPNGAGKSTTLKILAGYLPPTEGTARVGGRDVVEQSLEARRLLGYMPESVPLYPEMRVEEYLHFRAEIKGVARQARRGAVANALEQADLKDVARRLVGELSKGFKQRVGLADALVASPPLLILDEPTEGLDPNQILRFREVIRALGKGHTIFLSTHILQEVEAVCSRVVIIHKGRIAADGPLDQVRAELQGTRRAATLVVAVRGDALSHWQTDATRAATAALAEVPDATLREARITDGLARIELEIPGDPDGCGATLEALASRCVAAGLGLRELTPHGHSLERVFHDLTTAASTAPSPGAQP